MLSPSDGLSPNYLVHIFKKQPFQDLYFKTNLSVRLCVEWCQFFFPHVVTSASMGLILGSPHLSLKVVVVVVVAMRVVSQTQAFSLGSTALVHAVHLPCPQIPRYLGHELCHELN